MRINVVTIGYRSCDGDLPESQNKVEMSTDGLLIACVAQKPGNMNVVTVKKRWKYLKDCYMKDKKKNNEYIPSGSAASATQKSSFRFYETMSFLSDCMETRQTVSTLSKNLLVPSQISQSSPTSPINTECSTSSSNNSYNSQLSKKRKSSIKDADNLDEAFIATLMSEPAQNDPIHCYALSG
ncbi:uncharacterized protein [Anoplolepis gracilipes]|uniref:uncharacterized protein n=1 Tax=Anoplolepis gracilipes TaxID=354296 RepID=UPI003BA3D807